MSSPEPGSATRGKDYEERLTRLQTARWKQWIDVQAPFRWHMQRLDLGFTLDIGCGIGRTLLHVDGHGVGVDTNPHCIEVARSRGLTAFTPDDFWRSEYARPARFDSLLLANVAEHMREDQAVDVLRPFEPCLKTGGRLIILCPQEAGFHSDATHVEFMDFTRLRRIAGSLGLVTERTYSFPFPRWAGRFFTYNEFVVVSRKPPAAR